MIPIQPMYLDSSGYPRFRANSIIRALVDRKVIDLCMAYQLGTPDDAAQLAMLVGYSLGGFGELSFVSDEVYARAELAAEELKRESTP